jgi:hypothetical protein
VCRRTAQERPTRSVCLGASACCMHVCRGTKARVVADTGDRFFSHFPSSRPNSSLQTLLVFWQFAEGRVFPYYLRLPSALAFRLFCCSCLRVLRYVVSLYQLTFHCCMCVARQPHALPSRVL